MDENIESQEEHLIKKKQYPKGRKSRGYWNDYDNCYQEALKYHSSGEFFKKAVSAHRTAKKNNWIKDYTWFEEKCKPNGYWNNYDNCYNEAKNYHSCSELKEKSSTCYKYSCRNGWIEDYTWFIQKSKPSGYWNNYENCYNEAKKYKSRGEFSDKSPTAWKYAKKNGWIEDYYWFEEKRKPLGYWTRENVYREAMNFSTITEFEDKFPSAVAVARKNGWTEDFTWMVKKERHPSGWWNAEHTRMEALKYTCKSDFIFGNNSAYNAARKNGWLETYDWFTDKRFDLFQDKIDSIYVYEFEDLNTVYVGRTLMRCQKRRDYCHLFRQDSVSDFCKKNDIALPEMKIIETELTIKEGAEREQFWIDYYKDNGWVLLNKVKGGSLGGIGRRFSKYTYEVCYQAALSCSTRGELLEKNASIYNKAWHEGWLDDYTWLKTKGEVCSETKRVYTERLCFQEAQKYQRTADFKKESKKYYQAAVRYGWIKDYTWLKHERKSYDKDSCFLEAQKYTELNDFRLHSNGYYRKAQANGWLSEYTWLKRRSYKNLSTEDIPNSEE